MELCIFTEPQQGASYATLALVATTAERLGFHGFFRSDHWLKMGNATGLPGPTDSWITLGAIARETSRLRLGTLVTSATFRHPSVLAISVAQVDAMSSGRVELGIGTGWFQAEHDAYGIELPPVKERFDRLAEQLDIITGLWSAPADATYTYDGAHYRLKDAPALPKPVQHPVPVIIGGSAKPRSLALAVRHASEYNSPFAPVENFTAARRRVLDACSAAGRDPETMRMSSALVLCCGEDDAEVARRAAVIGRDPEELRRNGLAGTVEEIAEKIRSFEQAGANRLYLQLLDLSDLDQLELVAATVVPLLG